MAHPRTPDSGPAAAPPPDRRSVLVVTVVHNPEDARIRYRQIDTLVQDGWRVTYAAPFSGFHQAVPADVLDAQSGGRLTHLDVVRARGRRRVSSWRAARRVVRRLATSHDVVLVHDPELLIATTGLRLQHLVWDVHEDPAAALQVKTWMPRPLRTPVAALWRRAEHMAERRHALLLAEYAYQDRFATPHVVVPNAVRPEATRAPLRPDHVVYLGTVTLARGCRTIVAAAAELRRRSKGAVVVEVIGGCPDAEAKRLLTEAQARGDLVWTGFLPSEVALGRVRGAIAGLCPLHDLPNYRSSMPTKVVEYCALGVPVITTPLPIAADLVTTSGAGVVVPFQDPIAVVDAVLDLRAHPEKAERMGDLGQAEINRSYDWATWSKQFVHALDEVGATRR